MARTVFVTRRGQRHQQAALAAAPPDLEITMLRQPGRQRLLAHLARAEYLISERSGPVDKQMIEAAPHLKMILRLGSLTYDIDTEAARAAGVIVCYWPLSSVIHVAEHLVLQMLALARHLRRAEAATLASQGTASRRTTEDTFAYNWTGHRPIDSLHRKTIGIIGFGEIGAELARRLKGWECRLLYNKRSQLPPPVEAELGLAYVDTAALPGRSDYLVNLLPYSPATDLMLNAAYFAKMKPGAYLVSCGSGSVLDETALAQAIKEGRLAGAALDTFDWEPLRPDHPLLALARSGYNVLLTPHIAAGEASIQDRADDYTNIINHMNRQPIQYRAA